jgi:hypothetical protein
MESTGLIVLIGLILGVMFGPPLLLLIIGLYKRKTKPETAKVLFILAGIYVLIGGGICATLLNS